MLDVSTLAKATPRHEYPDYGPDFVVWTGEAHGCVAQFLTYDTEAEFFVSPIWNMRQKGVALVDEHGTMVANERTDR
jgi:hypothetical protein